MSFITYPRTAAELRDVISLGIDEVIKLLHKNKLRVNLRSFLHHVFHENNYDDKILDQLNLKLLAWDNERTQEGLPPATMVYHHSGVRLLNGFSFGKVKYERKADRSLYKKERGYEFSKKRVLWLKDIAMNNSTELKTAGISSAEIQRMIKHGLCPRDNNGKIYHVHHRIPLDDGGTNDSSNFILIRDDVEHRAVHGYYNPAELRIKMIPYGGVAEIALPIPPSDTLIYPNPELGYVAEIVPNANFIDLYYEKN